LRPIGRRYARPQPSAATGRLKKDNASMPIDRQLLELLACPDEHHAPLREVGDFLVCTQCGRRFPVKDGIPVMLLEEALPPAD